MQEKLLPERLKAAREKIGITKAEAARRLGLSKIGYCRYEYGERKPSLQTLELIAQCFNTSIDYLLGYTEDDSPNYILINKNIDPMLYKMAQKYNNLSPEQKATIFQKYYLILSQMDDNNDNK